MSTLPQSPEKVIFAPDRYQYTKGSLSESQLNPKTPFQIFHRWFNQASSSEMITSPEALTLSTSQLPSGRVSSRTVLLKQLDSKGFVFYSNWETSKKARDIKSNPRAALTFWWEPLQRQVRVEGVTEHLSQEESKEYFDTRPRKSRIGAWASAQSTLLHSRDELDAKVSELENKFAGMAYIPIPPFWGGMRIIPDEIEFWQGRDNRLHDRFIYERQLSVDGNHSEWTLKRLSP
ncbi:putative pyridoxamine 5'-phosphate oxidase [Neolecta irregularis DAH-3]|uniref:pyridoxal 5'-phosphate synthase n=1 Tax=Neolecta irregularis (strain DAH-3) TaxID=1198029 RepID=A0A1U7LSK6_NEOID|nr:putative pyridoxamine 5'-phosphate oxidase [Neolecta irregularis DAH-3]|eukprot:OLL25501.1 putative pyridoxamine 5'-phosphate oxidase [Neolecta irregularis DAH-3]